MRRWLAIALIGACTSCGCRATLQSGTVAERHYEPAHTETVMRQHYMGETCTQSGKTRTCSPNYIWLPEDEFYSDRWEFKLRSCDSGECVEDWIDVDHDTFDRYEPGQHYPDAR